MGIPQNRLTDDDILEAADRLAEQIELDDGQRNATVLMVQRLVWPPSPWDALHDVTPAIVGRRPASGELRCPHGCQRAWRVNHAPDRSAVYDALMAAHQEYRSGRITSESVPEEKPQRRRIDLAELFGRSVAVEVTDERITS